MNSALSGSALSVNYSNIFINIFFNLQNLIF